MGDYKNMDFMGLDTVEGSEAPTQAHVRFADLGLNDTAYVKRATVDGQRVWAIHAADGTPLTTLSTRATAFAAVRQHALDPVSVH